MSTTNTIENQFCEAALRKLGTLEDRQPNTWLRMLRAHDSALYPLDLLAMGALNRSAALCAGFRTLIEQRNFVCAASILRLQLDNALRFYAAFLVDEPHAFASAILEGTPVRKLKDRSGILMRDAHLVDCLSKEYSWVVRVYETTSGYIHLSEQHIFQAAKLVKSGDRVAEFKMSATDKTFPEETYVEAIEAFYAATELFLHYVEGWIHTKSNPDEVTKLREALRKRSGRE
jgi:hypothetical protein